MCRINLNKYGENLGTRILGREIFSFVEKMTNDLYDEQIILDFEGVNVITNSFADELIGKNIDKYGFDCFKKKFLFDNTSKNIKLVLKGAIINKTIN